MKKSILFIAVFLLLKSFLFGQNITVHFRGNIDSKELYIYKINRFDQIKSFSDTNLITKESLQSKMSFSFDESEPTIYKFFITNQNDFKIDLKTMNFFYIVTNGNSFQKNIDITIDVNGSIFQSYQDDNQNFNLEFKVVRDFYHNFYQAMGNNPPNSEDDYMALYEDQSKSIIKNIQSTTLSAGEKVFLFSFVNPKKNASLIANEVKNHRDVELVHSLLEKIEKDKGVIQKKFIFTTTTVDEKGEVYKETSNANYYFVSFWASWCMPCRKNNRTKYLELYNYGKEKDLNLKMISISLDEDAERWKEASKKDNIQWTNLIDTENKKSLYHSDYHFHSLPKSFLLDKNMKIIMVLDTPDDWKKLYEIITK